MTDEIVLYPSKRYLNYHILFWVVAIGSLIAFLYLNSNFISTNLIPLTIIWKVYIVFIGLISFYCYLWRNSNKLILSDTELIEKKGIFSCSTNRMPIRTMTNFRIEQSFSERLLGISNIFIDCSGGLGVEDEITLQKVNKSELSLFTKALSDVIIEQRKVSSNN